MEKETWINEVLESTQGITTVVPDALLFSKIQSKIKVENTIPMPWFDSSGFDSYFSSIEYCVGKL